MANRLNIPEDLEQLVEKREQDRRLQDKAEAEKSQPDGEKGHSTDERRKGTGRRADDRS